MDIKFLKNYSLAPHNTMRVPAKAKLFTKVTSISQLRQLIQTPEFKQNPTLTLGGGSNFLFVNDFPGLVIKIALRGKKIGNVWMHKKHAPVPTHNGKATGGEILDYTQRVRDDVWQNYRIKLESEVRVINSDLTKDA